MPHLFDTAYQALLREERLDARLRALFPAPFPTTETQFFAAMEEMHLSPSDKVREGITEIFSEQHSQTDTIKHLNQPSTNTPFAKFRRGFAYAAFAGLSDVSPSSISTAPSEELDPTLVADAVAKLRLAVEEALARAERRVVTPKNKQIRPRRSSLLLSPSLTEEFFTPRESLKDVQDEASMDHCDTPRINGQQVDEDDAEQEIWYTPRPPQRVNDERTSQSTEPDTSSQLDPDRQNVSSPASVSDVSTPHHQDNSESTGSPLLPSRLFPGVSSAPSCDADTDVLNSSTGHTHHVVDTENEEPGQQRESTSSSAGQPSSVTDDTRNGAESAEEQTSEPKLEGKRLLGTPSSSADTHLDDELLFDADDDHTLSNDSLDTTLPEKLHPGIVSALSVWEPDSMSEHDLKTRGNELGSTSSSEPDGERTESATEQDGVMNPSEKNESMSGEFGAHITSDRPVNEQVASPESRCCSAQPVNQEEEKTPDKATDQQLPVKLHPGLTSSISPVDIKAVTETADDTEDVKREYESNTGIESNLSDAVHLLPNLVSLSDSGEENVASTNKHASVHAQRLPTMSAGEENTFLDCKQTSSTDNTARSTSPSSDRRTSCTVTSTAAVVDCPTGKTLAADDMMPAVPVRNDPDGEMVQEAGSPDGPPRPKTTGSPVLTADARGVWSISTCAASRDLEEEIQAGEADMPAWGRSPAGWAARCCELEAAPESDFESPVLCSSSPVCDSTRVLSFSSSDGEGEDDNESASTLSLGTRDTLGREVEEYVREMERLRERKAAGAGDSFTMEVLTLDASDESELTPAGFDAVRQFSKPSCLVDDAVGSAVSTRPLSGRATRVADTNHDQDRRLDAVLEAVRESVEVCRQVREELGWRRKAKRTDAAMLFVMLVGIGVAAFVRMLRAEAFLEVMI